MAFENKLNKILSFNSPDHAFIESLNDYINSIESSLDLWLKQFEWNKDILIQKHSDISQENNSNDESVCPFDPSHTRIKKKNFTKHIEVCKLKKRKYTSDDIKDVFLQPESHSKYQLVLTDKKDSNDFIQIICDDTEYNKHPTELISFDNKHVFTDLTAKERLGIHEYALRTFNDQGFKTNTNQRSFLDLSHFDDETKKNGDKVFIDLFDKKRRPKSYKTSKSVSHTEKIKQLIDYQMGLLEDLNKKDTGNIGTDRTKHKSLNDKKRSYPEDTGRRSKPRERSHSRHNHSEEKVERKKHKSHKKKKKSSKKRNLSEESP